MRSNRKRPVEILLAASACLFARSTSDAGSTVRVILSNPSAQRIRAVPVTFGQAFRIAEFPATVGASIGGRALPAQVDILRRHDDGSVRFACISAIIDEIGPAQELGIDLAPRGSEGGGVAPVSIGDLLKTEFDAIIGFRFPDGAERQASARQLLEEKGGKAATWLRGPIVTEWIVSGPPRDDRGVADEDLDVRFQIRGYRGLARVCVSIAVENCWDTWADNIRYDVWISVGGREVFRRQAVDHRPLSRWRRVFWWGGEEPAVHIAHDLAYLTSTGALPNYDRSLPAPSRRIEPDPDRRDGPDWDILGRGPLTAYMPTTGGRPEIAPYPLWTVRHLLSMRDREAKAFVLAAGDLAGSWPIHVRARKTDRILTIDERPEFWLDERGKDRPEWKPRRHAPDPTQVKLDPDLAHQPSLAFVPYLATGDYYYLEEAYFWANYCLLSSWPYPRKNERGILAGQIRGDAWSLRNIADAAWIARDADPEKRYFVEKMRNNIADRIHMMYGPPEYNAIGAWGLRSVEDARIQNPPNPRWIITAPWEEDYLLWSLHHLVELGYAEAGKARDFLLRMRVGMLTHAPDFDPRLATPYRMVVGEFREDKTPAVYDDWKTLGRENALLSKPDVPNYGCSYAYSARAALISGIDAGFPRAREALAVLDGMLPDHRQVMANEPFWAIAPGGAKAQTASERAWLRKRIPGPNAGNQQTACLVLDVDGDGLDEFVVAERTRAPSVVWYKYNGAGWDAKVIDDTRLNPEAGGAACDIDGDGDPDVILGQDASGSAIWWWENPRPEFGKPWVRRIIKDAGPRKHHDQTVADYDGDGRVEFVSWNQGGRQLLFFEIPADPKATGPWPSRTIYSWSSGQELEGFPSRPADIDLDGVVDLAGGGRWFKRKGDGTFEAEVIDDAMRFTQCAAGQLVEGGRPEIVFSPGDMDGEAKWYEWDGKLWVPHTLRHVIHGHTCEIRDADRDGCADILIGEMGSPGHGDASETWIWYGDGKGHFEEVCISRGQGIHEGLFGDFDGDGDLDVAMKPYNHNAPRIDILLNPGGRG